MPVSTCLNPQLNQVRSQVFTTIKPALADGFSRFLLLGLGRGGLGGSLLSRGGSSLSGGSAEQRLAGFLLSVCPKESPHIYHLPFTYLELAETLNIGRASLYRAMDSLQQYGVLQRNGRDLSILDPDVLRRIVSSAEQYAEQCLAAFLLSVCPEETPHVYHLPFTYLELSKTLNIGRASLYRAMNSLQRCGVLQRDGHDLFILDPDALRRMVSHTELDSVRHVLREQRIDKSSKGSQE